MEVSRPASVTAAPAKLIVENVSKRFASSRAAVQALDFQSNLGEVLEGCVMIAGDMAEGVDASPAGAEALGRRIYAIYTMAQERDIHLAFFPASAAEAPLPHQAAAQSDEELFEDALF